MEPLIILSYLCAIVIGLTLGLIGGGGSILTVPVIVYLFGESALLATSYSLFIVGATSLVGAVKFARKGQLDYKVALGFGIPSIITVYLTRKYLVPALPNELLQLGSFVLTKNVFLMLLFAVLMILASYSMIKGRKSLKQSKGLNVWVLLAEGVLVGVFTGMVGAGGGFLIIPALVVFAGLDMKTAVGTSLTIIAAKSLIGFLGDVGQYRLDWEFLMLFTMLSIVGIFIGSAVSNKIKGEKLKPVFGMFVLLMGVFILVSQIVA